MSQFRGKIDGEIILGMKQISLERYFSSAIINKKVSILSAEIRARISNFIKMLTSSYTFNNHLYYPKREKKCH